MPPRCTNGLATAAARAARRQSPSRATSAATTPADAVKEMHLVSLSPESRIAELGNSAWAMRGRNSLCSPSKNCVLKGSDAALFKECTRQMHSLSTALQCVPIVHSCCCYWLCCRTHASLEHTVHIRFPEHAALTDRSQVPQSRARVAAAAENSETIQEPHPWLLQKGAAGKGGRRLGCHAAAEVEAVRVVAVVGAEHLIAVVAEGNVRAVRPEHAVRVLPAAPTLSARESPSACAHESPTRTRHLAYTRPLALSKASGAPGAAAAPPVKNQHVSYANAWEVRPPSEPPSQGAVLLDHPRPFRAVATERALRQCLSLGRSAADCMTDARSFPQEGGTQSSAWALGTQPSAHLASVMWGGASLSSGCGDVSAGRCTDCDSMRRS
jgi:hypothetical protein